MQANEKNDAQAYFAGGCFWGAFKPFWNKPPFLGTWIDFLKQLFQKGILKLGYFLGYRRLFYFYSNL
jgi:hypothetical protein